MTISCNGDVFQFTMSFLSSLVTDLLDVSEHLADPVAKTGDAIHCPNSKALVFHIAIHQVTKHLNQVVSIVPHLIDCVIRAW